MIILSQSRKVIAPLGFVSFLATGGVEPYVFTLAPGGVGGSIDSAAGTYNGPSFIADPRVTFDTIIVTDANLDTAQARVSIGGPLTMLCDIIQTEMGLADGRVYLWNQKIIMPTDSNIFIAVSILDDEPFANVNRHNSSGGGLDSEQFVTVRSTIGLDIMSRGPDARERRFEVLFALASDYSQQQQAANGFYIARLPSGRRMVSLNQVDGSAIPYRFHIDISMHYAYSKNSPVDFFDNFPDIEVTANA